MTISTQHLGQNITRNTLGDAIRIPLLLSTERNTFMNLRTFLLKQTNAKELCVIREDGWIVATCWIDYEDLFCIPPQLAKKTVKDNTWGTLSIVNMDNKAQDIPCHYIDV